MGFRATAKTKQRNTAGVCDSRSETTRSSSKHASAGQALGLCGSMIPGTSRTPQDLALNTAGCGPSSASVLGIIPMHLHVLKRQCSQMKTIIRDTQKKLKALHYNLSKVKSGLTWRNYERNILLLHTCTVYFQSSSNNSKIIHLLWNITFLFSLLFFINVYFKM